MASKIVTPSAPVKLGLGLELDALIKPASTLSQTMLAEEKRVANLSIVEITRVNATAKCQRTALANAIPPINAVPAENIPSILVPAAASPQIDVTHIQQKSARTAHQCAMKSMRPSAKM